MKLALYGNDWRVRCCAVRKNVVERQQMAQDYSVQSLAACERPKRAFGRSLTDFRDDSIPTEDGLWPAEVTLIECAAKGLPCLIEWLRPGEATEANRIRSGLLRFLLLGGDHDARVLEKRLEVHGAYIEGDIDLEGVQAARSFRLFRCRVGGRLIGRDAQFGVLNLQGSCVKGVFCERAKLAGSVFLNVGFEAEGPVQFSGASINGGLYCDHGKFINPGGEALSCDGAKIADCVMLTHGFSAEGLVNFSGAQIGRQFSCDGGRFEERGRAPRQSTDEPVVAAYALDLSCVRIGGELRLSPEAESEDRVVILGSLNLMDAYVEVLADGEESWPGAIWREDGSAPPSVIALDGFVYGRFAEGAPADAESRERWLMRQPPDHLGENFRQQPFDQLAAVFERMEQENDAREIVFFRNCRQLRCPRKKGQKCNPLVWLWWAAQWLLIEKLLGYGYRPERMAVLAFVVMMSCGVFYQIADAQGLFAPTNSFLYHDAELRVVCSINGKPAWTGVRCPLTKIDPDYTAFNPYLFSLDMMLPLNALKMKKDWRPLYGPFEFSFFGVKLQLSKYFVSSVALMQAIFSWIWIASLIIFAIKFYQRYRVR
jgi:hypothetical protein